MRRGLFQGRTPAPPSGEPPPPGFDPRDVEPPALPNRTWPITSVALDVSGRCNLACRYCAEVATLPRRPPMGNDVLDGALRLLAKAASRGSPTSLRLGSGEPLLAKPLLRRAREQLDGAASRTGRRTDVFLTTNGTLLDNRTADWLCAAGWIVKVSLDGPEGVHDAWRVTGRGAGSFARAAAAIARLVARMPERVSATAVLCRGADPEAVFDAIALLGVRRIELVPVAHPEPSFRPDAEDVRRYAAFVRRHALRIARGERVPVLVRFAGRVARTMGFDNLRVPCGAGRTFVGAAPDGGLYPCFRFFGLPAHRLGSVTGGVDPAAAAAYRSGPGRPYQARQRCRACWAAPLCGGPCFAATATFGASSDAIVAVQCAYVLADAHAAVELVTRLRPRAPERLLAFLPHAAAGVEALAPTTP
jgi:uncharacterized protein